MKKYHFDQKYHCIIESSRSTQCPKYAVLYESTASIRRIAWDIKVLTHLPDVTGAYRPVQGAFRTIRGIHDGVNLALEQPNDL